MGDVWKEAMADSFHRFLTKIVTFLPNLLAMITILIVGFFAAWIVKIVILHFLKAIQFDKVSQRWGLTHVLAKGGRVSSPAQLVSRFFYWLIVFATLILGINALEVVATQHMVAQFFNYLPHLFAAIVILVIGYLIAIFLGQATLIAAVNANVEVARLLSRAVRWFVIVLSFTMALDHLGIAENVIITAFTLTLGGIVLALSIAFGWGGREIAREFLEKICERKEKGEGGGDPLSHI